MEVSGHAPGTSESVRSMKEAEFPCTSGVAPRSEYNTMSQTMKSCERPPCEGRRSLPAMLSCTVEVEDTTTVPCLSCSEAYTRPLESHHACHMKLSVLGLLALMPYSVIASRKDRVRRNVPLI